MDQGRRMGRRARMNRKLKRFFSCCGCPLSASLAASSYSIIPAADGDQRSDGVNADNRQDYLRGDHHQVTPLGEDVDGVSTTTTKVESTAARRVTLEMLLLGEGIEREEMESEQQDAEEEEEEEASPRHGIRSPASGGWWCCVCMRRRKKGAAFISCGHTFCRHCARELRHRRGSCPLCNRAILDILDIF